MKDNNGFIYYGNTMLNDFDQKLLTHEKWHDKNFTKDQLQKHLVECLELLENGDTHIYAELIDLVQITKIFVSQNLDDDQLDELVQKRYEKFLSKLAQDKK
ncbi:MAG: hypothetical protein NT085_00365 [candidate division SR1 bacterium]|nr:hypothetical protein [candidate division SR1 bacterium]